MTKLCRLKLVGPVIMNQRVRVERVACVSDALVDVMTHLDWTESTSPTGYE